jgi:hypothetical protein
MFEIMIILKKFDEMKLKQQQKKKKNKKELFQRVLNIE